MYNNRKIIPVITIPSDSFAQLEQTDAENFSLFSNLYTFIDQDGNKNLDSIKDLSLTVPHTSNNYTRSFSPTPLTLDCLKDPVTNIFQPYISHNVANHSNSFSKRIKIHTFLNYLSYDWEVHKALVEKNNYVPVIVDSESSLHSSLFKDFLDLYNQDFSRSFPDFKIYSKDEVQFIYWKNNLHVFDLDENDLNSEKVYSLFSENIYKKLKTSCLNYSSETNTFQNISLDFDPHCPAIHNNRAFYNLKLKLNPFLQNKTLLGPGGDLFFLKNTSYETTFENLLQSKNSSRLNVIKVPSWKSKSSDKDIELTSYTKSQVLKRQISFAGYLNTTKCLLSENNAVDLKFFNLVSFGNIFDLTTSSRALKRLVDLSDSLFWKDGIKIYDPSKVEAILQEIFSGLNVYSDACCSKLPQDKLEELILKQNVAYTPFKKKQNLSLTSKPQIDFNLKQKYDKINLLYTENLKKISSDDFSSQIRTARSINNDLIHYTDYLRKAKQSIKNAIEKISTQIEDIYIAANFIKTNNSIYSSIKTKYFQEFENSLLNMSFSQDDFFTNLSLDQIFITEIHYLDSCSKEKILFATSSTESFLDFIKEKNSQSDLFSITKVNFVIDRPVKIRVDSKNKFVLGGPYKVSCTKTSIEIALLRKESLFGINNNIFAVHPHTTTYSDISALFSYSRGCLGEATSLIYNAFEKNDLKLIILSAMTWVTSANSSDAWGRKYDTFPELSSLKDYSPEQQEEKELTDEEVENFLTSVCEDEDDLNEEENFLNQLESDQNEASQNEPIPVNPESTPTQQETWNPADFAVAPQEYVPTFSISRN